MLPEPCEAPRQLCKACCRSSAWLLCNSARLVRPGGGALRGSSALRGLLPQLRDAPWQPCEAWRWARLLDSPARFAAGALRRSSAVLRGLEALRGPSASLRGLRPELSGDSGVTTYCNDVTVESVCNLFAIADGSCGQSDPDGDVDITTKEPLKALLSSSLMSFMPGTR